MRLVIAAVALAASFSVQGKDPQSDFEHCFHEAARHQGLPVNLLKAIALQESSMNPKAVSPTNSNGTRDIGLMQVNSWWIPHLARYGVTENDLFSPCVNVHVGAWILAKEVARSGFTWQAIGAYNAGPKGSPSIQLKYAKEVLEKWKMFASPSQLAAK